MRYARALRWAEFLALFVVSPVLVAVVLPPGWMFPVLFAFTGLGLVLLSMTPGFSWRGLTRGVGTIRGRRVLVVAGLTFLTGLVVMLLTRPDGLFFLIRNRPDVMLMIAVFYPLLSALPQELIYRVLFFERYAPILPAGPRGAIALNAGLFAFAHLMYWSSIVLAMTAFGGALFAYVYRVERNFAEAVLHHALAGIVLFALGMGAYFYSGNVVRPF